MLMLIAATAGSLGALIGTPADVVLVRMSSDGSLPPGKSIQLILGLGLYFFKGPKGQSLVFWDRCK
jgi:hypothetical protein